LTILVGASLLRYCWQAAFDGTFWLICEDAASQQTWNYMIFATCTVKTSSHPFLSPGSQPQPAAWV